MIYRDMEKSDVEGLVCLWRDCFGDETAVARDYYRCVGVGGVVACDGEKITSMLNIAPIALKIGEKLINGGFVYAACTDKKMRGKGFFRALNEYAGEYMNKTGMEFLMLIPANDRLFPMYRSFGYTNEVCSARYADTGYTSDFDGNLDRLYSLYLDALPECAFVKSRAIFEYALGFEVCTAVYADGGYNIKTPYGRVLESSRIIGISEKPKALYRWAGTGYEIKERLTADFFGEDRHA